MGKKWDEKDTAKETNVSTKEASRTWHQAREDARESGEIPKKDDDKKK